MVNHINLFDGGFSAKFVVNDKAAFLRDVMDSFHSIVGIATIDPVGELTLELVSRQDRRVAEALHNENGLACLSLPLLVIRADHDTTADAAPQVVS